MSIATLTPKPQSHEHFTPSLLPQSLESKSISIWTRDSVPAEVAQIVGYNLFSRLANSNFQYGGGQVMDLLQETFNKLQIETEGQSRVETIPLRLFERLRDGAEGLSSSLGTNPEYTRGNTGNKKGLPLFEKFIIRAANDEKLEVGNSTGETLSGDTVISYQYPDIPSRDKGGISVGQIYSIQMSMIEDSNKAYMIGLQIEGIGALPEIAADCVRQAFGNTELFVENK